MRKNHRMLRIRGGLAAAVVAGMLAGIMPSAGAVTQDSGGGGSVESTPVSEGSIARTVACSSLAGQIRTLDATLCR